MKYIRTKKARYAIRGSWTVNELKKQYRVFIQKYGEISLDRWLIERGKVHFSVKKEH